MRCCVILLVISLAFAKCKNAPENSEEKLSVVQNSSVKNLIDSLKLKGHNIQNDLPDNYVKDATVDYTSYVQQAITKYEIVIFPGFPILINDKGLQVGSNRTLLFDSGSQLILGPSALETYKMLNIKQVSNVTLINPVIQADRNKHLGTAGESGIGIGIYSAKNIRIYNPKITDTWGDGIYIGGNSNLPSQDIHIEGAYIKNCRRNGISITNAIGVNLFNSYIGYSNNGTLPMDGIDIEPNEAANEIRDINITDLKTEYNNGYGIEFSLSKLYGGSNKEVSASVNNHNDIGSKSAVNISCYPKNAVNGEQVTGTITFKDPAWNKNPQYILSAYGLQEPHLHVDIISPEITNVKGEVQDKSKIVALLKKELFPSSSLSIQP